MDEWCVYILECGNGTLYTGITCEIDRRVEQHRSGRGAKYTRSFGVKDIVFIEKCSDKNSALQREIEIKKLTRKEKFELIGR